MHGETNHHRFWLPLIDQIIQQQRYGCPVELIDEHLSSREARQLLRDSGAAEQGDHLDALAAQLILQSWIDHQVRNGRRTQGCDEVDGVAAR